jgi:DNA polymerase
LWRGVHPRIEQLWQDAETAVRACLADRKPRRFSFCQVTMAGSWLRIQLPSGRFLCYPGAQIKDGKITYLGQNPYSRQWGRISTYGGKLVENITQGFARDILAHGLVDADKTYPIVLHVHDEGGAEVNEDVPLQGFIDCLIKPRSWTQGLPLTAKGFETTRYRKD